MSDLRDALAQDVIADLPPEATLALAAARSSTPLWQAPGARMADISSSRVSTIATVLADVGITSLSQPTTTRHDIAIIGRLANERWKRGGIFHSNQSYVRICEDAGLEHVAIEIDQDIREIARQARDAQVIFNYTGDQIAQDYFNVEPLVRHFDVLGRTVVVNLS